MILKVEIRNIQIMQKQKEWHKKSDSRVNSSDDMYTCNDSELEILIKKDDYCQELAMAFEFRSFQV